MLAKYLEMGMWGLGQHEKGLGTKQRREKKMEFLIFVTTRVLLLYLR
jgi:hypothetical protein